MALMGFMALIPFMGIMAWVSLEPHPFLSEEANKTSVNLLTTKYISAILNTVNHAQIKAGR
jgi:hypothetical protein